jgi:DNA polymerase
MSATPPASPAGRVAVGLGGLFDERPPIPANLCAADALEHVRQKWIGDCTRCKLHSGRSNIVFGTGDPEARLMFVGEGPGRDEDLQGEPFVGRAGQLLTRIIEAIGKARSESYIANVVKCRPPDNRNPEPDEVAACREFLEAQIDIVQPEVLVLLGKVAAQVLLDVPTAVGRLRGRFHRVRGIPAMVTWHTAYLLRNPNAKRDTWEDMKMVRDLLARSP